jgi:hypothetical protein
MKKYLKFIVKLRFAVNVNVGPIETTTDETTTFKTGCNTLHRERDKPKRKFIKWLADFVQELQAGGILCSNLGDSTCRLFVAYATLASKVNIPLKHVREF